MHLPRRLFCTVLLGLAAGLTSVSASAADPQQGAQYLVLPAAQPTDTGKKIEVIEFFAYYCPHCYAFEPALEAWVKKQGDDVVFKRVHIQGGAGVLPQQRLFYTLDAMGLLNQYHQKVFDAMHQQHLRLSSDEQVFDWVAQNGIDRAKFIDTYRSFGIQARLRRAATMMDAYGVDRWPLVVIDGRYVTSPSHAGAGAPEGTTEAQQQQQALQVMDFLVAKAKADKR
ncbi:thiol:disulfide interchange protein DsbA/DsbL [Massilia sp. TW-1]|uniref:Thiol:disulfide interchange protein n=1 Tax=Telluria antibiotica TaxID=2717319 RepID=A0ABX0PH99_9BURK|nr:thiol:disulfide interchange protein DsbA/DsbL [Telluria antibiotica]NIA56656.1 thiol:disulfide interchange protein DsbA/DsbL [Telluria antibiotica]